MLMIVRPKSDLTAFYSSKRGPEVSGLATRCISNPLGTDWFGVETRISESRPGRKSARLEGETHGVSFSALYSQ